MRERLSGQQRDDGMRRAVRLISPDSIFFWMNKGSYRSLRRDFDSFADLLDRTVSLLQPAFERYFEGKGIGEELERILALEAEMDEQFARLQADVRSLEDVAALEKEDLLRLLSKMEEVADYVEFIARLLRLGEGAGVRFPPDIQVKLMAIVTILCKATGALDLALKEHREMTAMEKLSREAADFEHRIDDLYLEFMAALMSHRELGARDYAFIKDVGTLLEDMSDALDAVGDNQRVSIFAR